MKSNKLFNPGNWKFLGMILNPFLPAILFYKNRASLNSDKKFKGLLLSLCALIAYIGMIVLTAFLTGDSLLNKEVVSNQISSLLFYIFSPLFAVFSTSLPVSLSAIIILIITFLGLNKISANEIKSYKEKHNVTEFKPGKEEAPYVILFVLLLLGLHLLRQYSYFI